MAVIKEDSKGSEFEYSDEPTVNMDDGAVDLFPTSPKSPGLRFCNPEEEGDLPITHKRSKSTTNFTIPLVPVAPETAETD